MAASRPDVAIVGGGVIGLGIAWRSAQAGLRVTVVDPAPGSGASWAAAGMLAPVTEAHYGEEPLLRLNLAAAASYPAFVAELEEAAGAQVGYRTCGTLAVGFDTDDRAALARLHGFQSELGLDAQLLTSQQARSLEPLLAPGVRAGLLVAGDHQVDNRLLVAALRTALERSGVEVRQQSVAGLRAASGRAEGVVLTNGDVIDAATVVLAAGCWSAALPGLPPEAAPAVRPVKGQILRLRGPVGLLSRNVRGMVAGGQIYLVPRADGQIVVGATVEEMGFDVTVRAGGVYELLRDAHALLPGVTELELTEVYAGLRPGSPDNAPMIGESVLPGLVVATGHFRNGILLTPVTAQAVAELLTTGTLPAIVTPFSPRRFAEPEAPAWSR